MLTNLTRDQARQYFKDCGLSYKDVDLRALRYLEIELNNQFNLVAQSCLNGGHCYPGGGPKPQYWVRVNPAKYYKGIYAEDGHLIKAAMTATGTYFTAREVITFHDNGDIGFAGEADKINVQPVLAAFMLWCDWLRLKRGESNG